MGFMDKVKNLSKGRNAQMKKGLAKAEQVARARLSAKHDRTIDTAADKARAAVDQLDPPPPGSTPRRP